jgi:hypothetical protein
MDLFLNPAYMIAGAALISAPIIIHLINRMRYKRIRWAAMEFLLKSQKRNRRRLIIEQLILLLLRCALVALAGFLVARYIGRIGVQGERDVDHFVLVDDTLSMSDTWKDEVGKQTTSFDVAKQKVLEIAKEALKANSKQYMHLVLLSDLDNEVKINDDGRINQSSLHTLESKLADLKPSKMHVNPAAGVKWARAQQTDPNHQRMLHFVSDLRESDYSGSEYENLTKELDGFTANDGKVLLFDVAYQFRTERQAVALHQENIGISDLRPETRFTAEGLPVQFTATIKNYTAANKNVFLEVKVDGLVRFEATQPVELKPGDNKHTFLLSFNKGASNYSMVSASVTEKSDAASGIPDDNIRVTVIQVKSQVPILMVDGSEEKEGGAHRDSYYLQKLFADAAKGYQIVLKPKEELETLDLTPDRFPCLYLLDVPDLSDKALKKLETYVEQGGHVAIFVGDHVKPKFYNDKLFAKGDGLFPVPLDEKKPERISGEEKFRRLFEDQYQIFFRDDAHPIFKEVADPKVKEVFKFLSVEEYWPAQNRLQWNADQTKVHELVTLPNRGSAQDYNIAITEIRDRLAAVIQDDKFEKVRPALERHQKRLIAAIGEGTLYPLASALDLLLNDRGDPRNPAQSPDLKKDFWDAGADDTLRGKITALRDAAMFGDPLVVTKTYGKGEVVAFLTTAGKNWNDWPGGGMASPTYPVVMLNLQKYLTSASDESSRNVGAPLDVALDADGFTDRMDVSFQPAPHKYRDEEKDDMADATARKLETVVGKEDEKKVLHFSYPKPREPGVYYVTVKGKPKASDVKEPQAYDEAFVYNVDTESEGNLKRAARDVLERGSAGQPGSGKVSLIAYDTRLAPILAPRRKDMSEAPWLYLVILIVLIIEQALAVHLSFHLKGNEAQLPPGVAGEARTPVPTSDAA